MCPVCVLKLISLLFSHRVGHFGDLSSKSHLASWQLRSKGKGWRLTEVNLGCLNRVQGTQTTWNTGSAELGQVCNMSIALLPSWHSWHSKMLGAPASIRLKWEQQTLRKSVLHLIRLYKLDHLLLVGACRVEVKLMQGKRCLFQRDKKDTWRGNLRLCWQASLKMPVWLVE